MRCRPYIAVLLSTLAAAQTADPPLKLGITTRLVQVNVIVRDKNGPVAGLKKDDFTLFDRKKAQKIAFFSEIATRNTVKPPVPLAPGTYTNHPDYRREGPTTATIVLLDALNTPINDQIYAKNQFIKFLATLKPEDRIAVYLLSTKLTVLNDFTNDARRLVAAAKKYTGQIVAATQNSDPDPNKSISGDLTGTVDDRDVDRVLNKFDAALAEQSIINRVETTAAAMQAIANHVANIPGRKNLVWITASFPISVGQYKMTEANTNPDDMVPLSGRKTGTTSSRAAASAATPASDADSGRGSAYSIYGANTLYSDAARAGFRGFEEELRRAGRALNNANIAVYPVDARGLVSAPKVLTAQSGISFRPGENKAILDAKQSPMGLQSMQAIAEHTGGRAFFNTNDLKNAVRDALDDSEVTYTLGFYVDSKSLDSKFHDITVAVNRKDVEVRFRKGYVAEPDPAPTADDRAIAMRDAIWSPLEATGIQFAARIDRITQPKPGARITLSIGRDQIALPVVDGKRSGTLDIAFVQQSDAGDELEKIEQKIPIRIDQAQFDALSQGLVLDRTIVPLEKAVQVRVVLADRTSGLIGSLTVPLKQ